MSWVRHNLVNRDDLLRIARKTRDGGVREAFNRVARRRSERVVSHWDAALDLPPRQWWEIDACRRRWNEKISGDPQVDLAAHVGGRFLADRTGLRAISVGCGNASRERRWARLGAFDRIDAFDVAPAVVEAGRSEVAEAGLDDVLHLHLGDVTEIDLEPGSYDVALGLHSLHHFSPVAEVVARLALALRPDGYLVVDDYVGPTRFQWTARQLEAAESLLRILPERYRLVDGGIRRRIGRPSIASMLLDDPSEAVESERILPAIRDCFEVVEEWPYGGSILQLTLSNISQHFLGDDAATRELLDLCFSVEDALMAEGEVGSDFVALVARPRSTVRPAGSAA